MAATLRSFCFALLSVLVICQTANAQHEQVLDFLKIGDTAPDVELQPLATKEKIKLSTLAEKGPVVLAVLRGYPGYQCPACSRQLGDLVQHAADFERLGATVVLVYPGPAAELNERAEEFLQGTTLPENFLLALDPDYAFTNLFHLRWDEASESSYPSTFVLDPKLVVRFRKTSFAHANRAKAADVIETLEVMQAANKAQGQEIPQDGGNFRVTR